jgi:hexosaminidase
MTQLDGTPGAPSSVPPVRPRFPTLRVVPLPTSFTTGHTSRVLAHDVDFVFRASSASASTLPPPDLVRAIERTKTRLRRTRHQYLSPTGGSEFFEHASRDTPVLTGIVLDLSGPQDNITSIAQCAHEAVEARTELEAYSLSIPVAGQALIRSGSTLGLLRGLTTLEQLVYRLLAGSHTGEPGNEDGVLFLPHAPYEISDQPAFGWRGLLLDTSRHWFSLQAMRKVSRGVMYSTDDQLLDTMSLVKLNVFHWCIHRTLLN